MARARLLIAGLVLMVAPASAQSPARPAPAAVAIAQVDQCATRVNLGNGAFDH